MNFDFKDLEKEKKEFFNKCEYDMEKIRNDLQYALSQNNLQSVDFLTYKYTMCSEIYDLLKCNGSTSGLGHYLKLYGKSKTPLYDVFSDYTEKCPEPRLMNCNKLCKLLDKKGV